MILLAFISLGPGTGFGVLMVAGRLVDLNRWFQQKLPEWLRNL
ncbi:MAG: hypothetical protein ABIJ48_05005 [Actinomycetota bacterium]